MFINIRVLGLCSMDWKSSLMVIWSVIKGLDNRRKNKN